MAGKSRGAELPPIYANLAPQSSERVFGADLVLKDFRTVTGMRTRIRTNQGHRPPPLDLNEIKIGIQGDGIAYSFEYHLRDSPLSGEEVLTLEVVFWVEESK